MDEQRPHHRSRGLKRCQRVPERLVNDLLKYSQELLKRIGLRNDMVSIQLHEGYVTDVTHSHSTHFPVPGTAARGVDAVPAAGAEACGSRPSPLSPDEINARIQLRLNRLLQHFPVRFGCLTVRTVNGEVSYFCPSPPLRMEEAHKIVLLMNPVPTLEGEPRPPEQPASPAQLGLEPGPQPQPQPESQPEPQPEPQSKLQPRIRPERRPGPLAGEVRKRRKRRLLK